MVGRVLLIIELNLQLHSVNQSLYHCVEMKYMYNINITYVKISRILLLRQKRQNWIIKMSCYCFKILGSILV